LVTPKGKAPNWDQFGNGNWATDPGYAAKIAELHRQLRVHAGS
jgi:flagellum-specific peptidoglycan hydrolase FlgJ